jgi:hypothetical protein
MSLRRVFDRSFVLLAIACLGLLSTQRAAAAEPTAGLTISWAKNYLTIRGNFPGETVEILYLEAYCRAGSRR